MKKIRVQLQSTKISWDQDVEIKDIKKDKFSI